MCASKIEPNRVQHASLMFAFWLFSQQSRDSRPMDDNFCTHSQVRCGWRHLILAARARRFVLLHSLSDRQRWWQAHAGRRPNPDADRSAERRPGEGSRRSDAGAKDHHGHGGKVNGHADCVSGQTAAVCQAHGTVQNVPDHQQRE